MFRILAEIVLRLTYKHKNVKTLGEIKINYLWQHLQMMLHFEDQIYKIKFSVTKQSSVISLMHQGNVL